MGNTTGDVDGQDAFTGPGVAIRLLRIFEVLVEVLTPTHVSGSMAEILMEDADSLISALQM